MSRPALRCTLLLAPFVCVAVACTANRGKLTPTATLNPSQGALRTPGIAATATAVHAASPPAAAVVASPVSRPPSTQPVTLALFGAGTLANPFHAIDKAFSAQYPTATVQAQFGGSVKEVKQVTDLGQQADVVAVADYSVIPTYMFGESGKQRYASWYAGFVANAITFVYTDQSKGAHDITPQNWYDVLAQPGVRIGRSNPDTDPSGYQTLQMLKLAETSYHRPGLSDAILKNAPATYIRDTETELVGALQAGEIDYLAIYKSDALQHHFQYIDLPAAINLSDPGKAATYASVSVQTKNGTLQAKPIIYALTIPSNAPHPDWAAQYVAFVLGPQGQQAMTDAGFTLLTPPLATPLEAVPPSLHSLVQPWPSP